MSLDWDTTGIENSEEVCFFISGEGNRCLSGVTEALIWATMEIDIGTITEKNWLEFWMRLAMADAVYGEGKIRYLDKDTSKYRTRSITKDEVRAHIGLRTNVSTRPSATFYKKMRERVENQEKRDARKREIKPKVAGVES